MKKQEYKDNLMDALAFIKSKNLTKQYIKFRFDKIKHTLKMFDIVKLSEK